MAYFKTNYYTGNWFAHADRAKYGTADSVSSSRGTDGKKNNTSEYNHNYYLKNKDKWGVKTSYSKDDDDFNDSNYSESNRVEGTDFFIKKKNDGSYVVLLEDEKWTVPANADIAKLKEQLKSAIRDRNNVSKNDYDEIMKQFRSGEEEFDVDAAAMDVIRGKYGNGEERKQKLGDDYAVVQKRVNELMKSSVGKNTAEATANAKEDKDKEESEWSKIIKKYKK